MSRSIDEMIRVYRDGLLHDTLPFWLRHGIDRARGGYLFFLDVDGTVVGTDKPMWIHGRFPWLLATLCRDVGPNDEWLEVARHGIDFLLAHGFDDDGRMFYSVTRDGRPLRKRRYLFTECFTIVALAACSRALGDASLLARAKELFEVVMRHHTTPGLLDPKVNPATRQLKSHAMPMLLLWVTQVLREVDDDPRYGEVASACVSEVLDDFVKPELRVLLERVGPGGEFLDEPEGREVNPGHAIETAWCLMHEAVHHRGGDTALIDRACEVLGWSLKIGWDREFGGIYYFRDCRGLPCAPYEHDMKLWWPHTEAIYATLLAHELTGRQQWAQWHARVHLWAYEHFPDRLNGEWFGYLHRDGTRSSPLKGNMWKGPFHLPRMQWQAWRCLERMKAKGVTELG